MCCSGRCSYEGHMGDCNVKNFAEITNLTGQSACYIGGQTSCVEEEEWWNEDYDKGNILKWQKIIRENKLVW